MAENINLLEEIIVEDETSVTEDISTTEEPSTEIQGSNLELEEIISDEDVDSSKENEIEVEEEKETVSEEITENNDSSDESDDFKKALQSMHQDFFPDATEEEVNNLNDFDGMKSLMASQFQKELERSMNQYKLNVVDNLIKDGVIDKAQVRDDLNLDISKEDIRDNEELAKQIITQYYTEKNIPQSSIDKIIEGEIDLEGEAEKLYDLLDESRQAKKQERANKLKEIEESKKKQTLEFNNSIKKEISELSKLGIKIDSDKEEVLFAGINKTFEKINSNPAKYYAMLSYLNDSGILDGKFDSLIKKGESRATIKLENILKNKNIRSGNTVRSKKNSLGIDNSDIPNIYK